MDQEKTNDNNELIYGRNSVMEALKSDTPINRLLVLKEEISGSLKAIVAMASEKGILITYQDRKKLDQLCDKGNHQGVAAYIAAAAYVEPEEILERAKALGEAPFVIILDEIQDPHNLGAIIRTADAVGAHGIILPKRRSCPLTGVVAKTSAGAVSYVPVARVTNIPSTIDYLKEQGLWIAGTDLDGDTEFFNADFKGPIGLVIGSEGHGMGKLTRSKCDFVVTIPMKGSVTSLNASVAAGVVMYEVYKQHRGGRA